MPLEDLTPSNRFELALSGDMTAEEASNRIEKILAGADIEPADRLEYFLKLRVSGGGGGGGGESPKDRYHYAGTFEMLPSQGDKHTYEIPIILDPADVAFFFYIPRRMGAVNNRPVLGWVNENVGISVNGSTNGFNDEASEFRYDSVNHKIIIETGTWKIVCSGPTDVYYVLKEA